MSTYQIISKAGIDQGTFEGRTETEALYGLLTHIGYTGQVRYDEDDDTLDYMGDEDVEAACGHAGDYDIVEVA